MTEREKMLSGALYDPGDPELVAMSERAQLFMAAYNVTTRRDREKRRALLSDILGSGGDAVIRPPFHVDYGCHIHCGAGVFLNFGCVVLDVCEVHIGDRTQIGPYVQILTADHPRDAGGRASGLENGKPIAIGADVWIGGGAILLPGITVGDGAVIGAGAVVTRDVTPHTTVGGNPARQIGPARQP